jgi:hypothetical protein
VCINIYRRSNSNASCCQAGSYLLLPGFPCFTAVTTACPCSSPTAARPCGPRIRPRTRAKKRPARVWKRKQKQSASVNRLTGRSWPNANSSRNVIPEPKFFYWVCPRLLFYLTFFSSFFFNIFFFFRRSGRIWKINSIKELSTPFLPKGVRRRSALLLFSVM